MAATTKNDQVVVRVSEGNSNSQLVQIARNVGYDVRSVGSTGVPAIEPLVLVTDDGTTRFYAQCTPERLQTILSQIGDGAESLHDSADDIVKHDPQTPILPVADLEGIRTGDRRVMAGCGWRRPTNPTDYDEAGGFIEIDSTEVFDRDITLLGRGWGDWCQDQPVTPTWEKAREYDEDAVVIVNAHSNSTDNFLLTSAPFLALEGANAVANTVGSDRIIVYTSEDNERTVETVREAIENYPDGGPPIEVITGPPDYRAAEPTMAIEAIEGNNRIEARIRPPGPEEAGLHGRPTLVHTPRTVAHLAFELRKGEPADSRIVTIAGDVSSAATVELSEGRQLSDALDAVTVTGELKAACVGGRFGGITRSLNLTGDPESLAEADLGTEGVVEILSTDQSIVEFVGRRTQFAAAENCGRCVPCREGSTQLTELLRDVYDGTYDAAAIEELVRVMTTSSICSFGENAGRPARTAIAAFESEFETIAESQRSDGTGPEPMEVS